MFIICLYPIQMIYTSRRGLIKYEVCSDILSSRTRLFRTKYFAYNIKPSALSYYILKYKQQYLGGIISSWTFLTTSLPRKVVNRSLGDPVSRTTRRTEFSPFILSSFIDLRRQSHFVTHAHSVVIWSYFCHDVHVSTYFSL